MATPFKLSRAYPTRYGVPSITHVDRRMFTHRYFTHCLQCTFCHDWCCQDGVDVDLLHVRAMERHRQGLEAATGVPYDRWFTDETEEDDDVPGGATRRTNVTKRGCVFLASDGRGCMIHRFCSERGIDYHELKSLVDVLFPLTYEGRLLTIADEVEDGSLVCLDTGPTVYRGMRAELDYYFGAGFVAELDELEGELLGTEATAVAEIAPADVRQRDSASTGLPLASGPGVRSAPNQ